ncbi:SH3 domain-containing protein [Salinicola avicenniae]|uniref:SH3 domain-containing protein n=1 Tax=Salinicola avicenniae TaxID=2916836 RepID=UPI0020747397|nr:MULTISPECIES: SH3 domain-containing protein [unclassified Salinicola]
MKPDGGMRAAVLCGALMLSGVASADSVEVPAAPEDGGPRNWQVVNVSGGLNLRAEPSASAGIVARLEAGTLLDNLGCRGAEARAWCDVQPLGGGPRGYVAADFLTPAISPDGSAATGPDDSALRAGQGDYDATGSVPCAMAADQSISRCAFGVARSGGGYATVVIDKPDGLSRVVYFRLGRAIGAGTSEADPGEFRASHAGDLHTIRIGDERYEIPDAVVLGG